MNGWGLPIDLGNPHSAVTDEYLYRPNESFLESETTR